MSAGFGAAVRDRLGDQATPDVIALATAISERAEDDGSLARTKGLFSEAGLSHPEGAVALGVIRDAGLFGQGEDGRWRIEVSAEPRFEWDRGLQSAKEWSLELAACREIGPTAKLVGWVLREYAHTETGTVYLSSGRLAADLGRNEDNVKTYREKLQTAGWLEWTGEYRYHPGSPNRMKLWRLTVPDCPCGHHGRGGNPAEPRG
ncbi:helix-turn-helix domain-containing protein [Pseudonocardia sp. RS010]|uniref:helix-turn-helix domain-containing protein n=1 Tax=Pseudonocardia sp. RS010 TaxID=3385979 RepID=UPI0039A3C616